MHKACRDKGAPACVGLDPVLERLPAAVRQGEPDPVKAIRRFCLGVLEAVADHVPCVKVQSACFERYRAAGFDAFFEMIERARALGMLVIADAKRGDIDASSAHYAAGLLAGADGPDALTVNAYLGADGLEPFLRVASREGKGLFALVRTSNPGGDALQSLRLADGRSVSEAVADLIAEAGAAQADYLGDSGYSLLGAVVGATKPQDAVALRARMPQQIFLVPGWGAQGGGARDVQACFKPDGTGAIVTASRSVIYAFEAAGDEPWTRAVERAARDLKQQLAFVAG